jgi:hypothetical protein
MKETEKFNVYNRWWFWVIIFFVLISIISVFDDCPECNCEKSYEKEYNNCLDDLENLNETYNSFIDTTKDYLMAMSNYCEYDKNNYLCISQQELFKTIK